MKGRAAIGLATIWTLLPAADVFAWNGTFAAAPPMTQPLSGLTAVKLQNGDALFVAHNAANRCAAVMGECTATGPLPTQQNSAAAFTLPGGRVLLVGGNRDDARTALYDPNTNTWSVGPSLSAPRLDAPAVQLLDGAVLVVGGASGVSQAAIAGIERLDLATMTFEQVGALETPRRNATVSLLLDGRVLIAGGGNGPYAPFAEIYDPATGVVRRAAGLPKYRRSAGRAVTLKDGKVFVMGGWYDYFAMPRVAANAEVFDPLTETFTEVSTAGTPSRKGHTLTLLPDGEVLVAGGSTDLGGIPPETSIFSPRLNRVRIGSAMRLGRDNGAALLMGDGSVWVAGGYCGPQPGSDWMWTGTVDRFLSSVALFGSSFESADGQPTHASRENPRGRLSTKNSRARVVALTVRE